MMRPPPYYDAIRQRSASRWDQLERDPELAAPWHQLFKQVQSPRHVVSELLQNADDAGATEASVSLVGDEFVFTHNGEDFKEEHFASLCRFGYSNKRALHTIGFRGIGFKSVFSLGPTVKLTTPTLAVAFHSRRFTEPEWRSDAAPASATDVRVPTNDNHVRGALRQNLNDWLASPLSLLFFKSVKRLSVDGKEIRWDDVGPGPVKNSRWYALNGNPEEAYLLVRSEPAPFPEDALLEIRQERMVGVEQDVDYPPCAVEIVLGAPGRLYVVLPTGVSTELPFAINAPFIQDSARYKIKDPGVSPTNRWLLARAGELAGLTLLAWLGQASASTKDKACAYQLLPDVDVEDSSLDGVCGTLVEEGVREAITDSPILLTESGSPVEAGSAVKIPSVVAKVWPQQVLSRLFDEEVRPVLSNFVSDDDCQKLINWGLLDEISKSDIIDKLRSENLPKPATWRQLLHLWAYVSPEVTAGRYYKSEKNLKIIPAQGQDVLYSLSEVVRLGEKRLLQSDSDWEFLADYLRVLNPNWPRYMAEQRRLIEGADETPEAEEISEAYEVLDALGLQDASDAGQVLDQVASRFFQQKNLALTSCVRLAQIAAKLNAAAGASFKFVTRDAHLRSVSNVVLHDRDGTLEPLLPEDWADAHLLHADYAKPPTSCSSEDWLRWLSSGKAGLWDFVPHVPVRHDVWGKQNILGELKRRGVAAPSGFPYVTSSFRIDDWDFPKEHWQHWISLSKDDPKIWIQVVERILSQPDAYWSGAKNAKVSQIATTGRAQPITYDPIRPEWILKLSDLACLPDTRGVPHKPASLLYRTPSTEAVMDVEPFVQALLDRESTRPLLTLLGVRNTPTGPDQLLSYLRVFAASEKPPVHEVEKWYRRLDQMIDTGSTIASAAIKAAFQNERIILTEDGSWTTARGAFLAPDDIDAPGVALVRAAVRELSLWRKVGVADQPTADLAIAWLKSLPSGASLSVDDARRVKTLLPRHAHRVWHECGHWLTLAGEWAPLDSIKYALTMQSLVGWSHLHEWVKKATADLQRLPVEVIDTPSIKAVPLLADRIEERLERTMRLSAPAERRDWLSTLGALLARTKWDDTEEQAKIRRLGRVLSESRWQVAPKLEIIPYIDGTPAGTPRQVDALWHDKTLYVLNRPSARLARSIAQELGRSFRRTEIIDAIKMCFERPSEFISEYIEENFVLGPAEAARPNASSATEHDIQSDTIEQSKSVEPREESTAEADEPLQTDDGRTEEVIYDDDELVDSSIEIDTAQPSRPAPKPRAQQQPFIERFALGLGFKLNGDGRYHHVDGSLISKSSDEVFPWLRISARGDVVKRYWVKDHCIDLEPLEVDAEIWFLIDSSPEEYALVLADYEGKPIQLNGSRLRSMKEQGALILFPASYRLKVDHDRKY